MTIDVSAPTRRCWRCLQQFPCKPEDLHGGPTEWWLCDPCQASLIGPAHSTTRA